MIQESDRRDRLAHSQDDGTVNRNVKYLKKKKKKNLLVKFSITTQQHKRI